MTDALAPVHGRESKRPTVRERTAGLWLAALFFTARHLPFIPRLMRPIVRYGVPIVSKKVRTNTRLNANRIFGKPSPSYGREVVGSFYDFVIDVARSAGQTAATLRQQVVAVEGEAAFLSTRRAPAAA